MKTVRFADLSMSRENEENVLRRIEDLTRRGGFILGKEVDEFEQNFAAYCEVPFCIGVASGCDALLWMLEGLDIGRGDEVITVANTFIGTVLPILRSGATPVLVDCDPNSLQMSHEQVAANVTSRTKAILAVHLYGSLAPMKELQSIADKHGFALLEDAAQAHGARYCGRRAGSLGLAAGFSFYPAKNLGAWGDGGAVVTSDSGLAEKLYRTRNYGQREKYLHNEIGWNSRLDSIQSIVLQEKLTLLDDWNAHRRKVAAQYYHELEDSSVKTFPGDPQNEPVHHLFVVQVKERDKAQSILKKHGIETGIHYPVPIHLHSAFQDQQFAKISFPFSEKLSRELISLPMHPHLSKEEISRVTQCLKTISP